MKLLTSLFFLISVTSVFSQQQTIKFPNEDVTRAVEKLMEIGEEYGHNGGAYKHTYNVKTFSYSEAVKDLASNLSEDSAPDFKWGDILNGVQFYAENSGLDEVLDFLIEGKHIKAMFGIGPSESCDQSEYCSYYIMKIYLTNGEMIHIDFDYTT